MVLSPKRGDGGIMFLGCLSVSTHQMLLAPPPLYFYACPCLCARRILFFHMANMLVPWTCWNEFPYVFFFFQIPLTFLISNWFYAHHPNFQNPYTFFVFVCLFFFHQAGMCTITFCNYNKLQLQLHQLQIFNCSYIAFNVNYNYNFCQLHYNCFLFLAHNQHRLYFFQENMSTASVLKDIVIIL